MKKLQKKINVIFTGKYLKYWYAACIITVGIMFWDYYRNVRVSEYELTIFDKNGKVVEQKIVTKDSINFNDTLPVTRSYKPLK